MDKSNISMKSKGGMGVVTTLPLVGDYHGQIVELVQDGIEDGVLYSWSATKNKWNKMLGEDSGSSVDVSYQNDTPMPISIGGYSAGTTFSTAKTITEMLDGLLYPYVSPSISLASNPSGGYQEYGTSISSIQLNTNISKKSNSIVKVEYYKNGSLLYTNNSPTNGGSDSYLDSVSMNNTTTYYAKVYDDKPNSVNSNSVTFTYVYPIYIGSLNMINPTESDIKSMNKRITGKGNQSLSYTITSSRFCFAYPSSYGNLTSIKDPNNFEMVGSFTKTTTNFTMLDGKSIAYTVYVLSNPTTQNAFNLTYIF